MKEIMTKKVTHEPTLAGLKLNDEIYEDIYFQSGTCEDSHFTNCIFRRVDFEGVWINDTLFEICTFDSVIFYDVQAYASSFQGSLFSKVEFSGCNFSKTDFTDGNFKSVVFKADNIGSITDISGANFEGVNLAAVEFIDVEYDRHTNFPKGFNPSKYKGLILTGE